jgi:Uma2 family endonuclease
MGTGTLISVEEYLTTSYSDGDREYVDGKVLQRNVGEVEHSDVQGRIYAFLLSRYRQCWPGVEVRVQVTAARFRVPDVVLVEGRRPSSHVITQPPLLVVEVLSPDDRVTDLQDKIDDYLAFGIRCIWVVDPRTLRGMIHTAEAILEVRDSVFRVPETDIVCLLKELMA